MRHHRPSARALLAVLLAVLVLPAVAARADDRREATSHGIAGVVELFTSQGCSSCLPADALFNEMAARSDIVALAYHVDYWDYIGWKDIHGSAANTERQRAYARTFNAGTIYTPQAVINGRRDIVGSRREAITTALGETDLSRGPASVVMSLRDGRLHITADIGAAERGQGTPVLMLVSFLDSSETVIQRGENRGRTLRNSHAVRDWRILGMWDGKPLEVDMPASALKRGDDGKMGFAAILQMADGTGDPGAILAAAAIEF